MMRQELVLAILKICFKNHHVGRYLGCKNVFTFSILLTFLLLWRFYSFNVFIYKKTLTKRYANDEKHLLATATKPRHLDS